MKLLVAEGDARLRALMRQMVAGVASTICEAADGGEAVALCVAEQPDWVLLDWRVKPMGGLAATRLIKARLPETRVALLSERDGPALRAEAALAGACAYVLKEDLHELPALLSSVPAGPEPYALNQPAQPAQAAQPARPSQPHRTCTTSNTASLSRASGP